MRDFCHGWRRKAGLVTLLMTLVATLMWVRSLAVADEIETTRLFGHAHLIESACGEFRWTRWNCQFYFSNPVTWRTHAEPRILHDPNTCVWFEWISCEFIDEFHLDPEPIRGEGIILPYRVIVLPLTLLSAYLLLGKRRFAKPEIIVEHESRPLSLQSDTTRQKVP